MARVGSSTQRSESESDRPLATRHDQLLMTHEAAHTSTTFATGQASVLSCVETEAGGRRGGAAGCAPDAELVM